MALHIKDVPPLWRLINEVGLADTIEGCGIRRSGDIVGGYCQGFFAGPTRRNPIEHTRYLTGALAKAGAKYPNSHELCLGIKPTDIPVELWLVEATEPFRQAGGCVPVVITFNEVTDEPIKQIFASPRQLGEPILVRMMVTEKSLDAATDLMKRLVHLVRVKKIVPAWWPLFQSTTFDVNDWRRMRDMMDTYWQYTCFAMGPFTSLGAQEFLASNIVVAQVLVGHPDDITHESITIPPGQIGSFPNGVSYAPSEYLGRVGMLPHQPVFIVLGESRLDWSEEVNIGRARKILSVLKGNGIEL